MKTLKTTRDLQMLAFALKDEARVEMPKAWPQVRSDLSDQSDLVRQLSALFGDKTVLAEMRSLLADASKPLPQRQAAFNLLKRTGDAEATPIFASWPGLTWRNSPAGRTTPSILPRWSTMR